LSYASDMQSSSSSKSKYYRFIPNGENLDFSNGFCRNYYPCGEVEVLTSGGKFSGD
jgi:hypothetical protein